MEDHEIVSLVVKQLFNDRAVSQPIYCPEVKSEADADRLSLELPLIYVWNEDPTVGSCSISVNGSVVASALGNYVHRNDPRFEELRDSILAVLKGIAIPLVLKTCEGMQELPSVVFSREMYLHAVREDLE